MNKMAYIIIVNWNGYKDTCQCIESCRELDYSNFHILIVDNGSSDGSGQLLREQFSDIKIIETGSNLGFAGGNNVGIRYALEQGADYIWVLNNDTVVDVHCLDFLIQAHEADPEIGMAGNKIYCHHSPETIWYAGGEVDLEKGGVTHHIGKDLRDDGSYDEPGPTGYITGCSVLIKTEVIKDIGLMDENYFLYFEDVDWSLRAKQKGWKLFYEPRAKLWHKEGARREQEYSDKFIYYSIRNRLYFMNNFAPEKMRRCHLFHVKTILFFMKSTVAQGPAAALKPLILAARGYIDFYLYKKMGINKEL